MMSKECWVLGLGEEGEDDSVSEKGDQWVVMRRVTRWQRKTAKR